MLRLFLVLDAEGMQSQAACQCNLGVIRSNLATNFYETNYDSGVCCHAWYFCLSIWLFTTRLLKSIELENAHLSRRLFPPGDE
jgi:hypothetical protein